MDINPTYSYRIYAADQCCVFRKTKELFGGLSNMASGYPLCVNGHKILSSEALYQACRFPHWPEMQYKILSQNSPMTAKMVSKPYRNDTRPDWNQERIKIMRWCLRVKLAQNYTTFSKLLNETGDLQIVEDSSRDDFWGAVRSKEDNNTLIGVNALGRLLMELRALCSEKHNADELLKVEPLDIPYFYLLGTPILSIEANKRSSGDTMNTMTDIKPNVSIQPSSNRQLEIDLHQEPTTTETLGNIKSRENVWNRVKVYLLNFIRKFRSK